jgi:predicted transcriptional regulator of viral defense system
MGIKEKSKIEYIFSKAKKLPYFSLDDLASMETDKTYLKILFSRYAKTGKVIRIKKNLYVSEEYLNNIKIEGRYSFYLELLANLIHSPSYLSLEYVLYKHSLLTEMPVNFTSITKKKTASFSNKLGSFFYRRIKENLFSGFNVIEEGNFTVFEASKAKALFDFLYLRKESLINKNAFQELRINKENLTKKDLKEVEGYLKIENAKRMREIFNYFE